MKESDSQLIREAVKEAVHETLISLGLTPGNPQEMQADMLHLRHHRKGCEAVRSNIVRVFITVSVPAAIYAVWEAFKGAIRG